MSWGASETHRGRVELKGCCSPRSTHPTKPVTTVSIPARHATEGELRAVGRVALAGRQHDDRRTDLHPAIEVDDVLVGEADAARGDGLADILRLVGAVTAVQRIFTIGIEVEAARAHWVLRTARHVRRKRAKALLLTRGGGPAWPLGHAANLGDAGPTLRFLADRDAIADCLATRLDQIEEAIVGIDDDRSGRFLAVIVDDMALERFGDAGLGVGRSRE